MKFVLDQNGVLLPVEESRLTKVVKKHSKSIKKTILYTSAALFLIVGLQMYFGGFFLGFDWFQKIITAFSHSSFAQHAFTNIVQAKSF